MTNDAPTKFLRPINVFVARGSRAENTFRAAAGLPGEPVARGAPEVIAPGIHPTPAHDLVFHQGKTIGNLTFTNFYVGGAQSWRQTDIHSIDTSLEAAMSDPHLNNVMAQYFTKKPTTTFKPSHVLPGSAPAVISQGDIENLVANLHNEGTFDGFDLGSTVFNFMLPSGTILNTDSKPTHGSPIAHARGVAPRQFALVEEEEDSLHGLGGYHGSVHFQSAAAPGTIYYAVGAYSEVLPNGHRNGIPVFAQPWMNVVATFYHELNEARTDPDVEDAIAAGNDPSAAKFLGWVSRQGEECGDFPVFEAQPLTQVFQEVGLADGSGNVPVQFQYSNAVHGPEGPINTPHRRARRPRAH